MPPRAGQKRSAAQNAEPSSSKHASKKTRFVEPEDDPTNFAELVDSTLEGPSRKGKVNTQGYDSDSSDDGEGVVESRKKGDDKDDDDDDMFAQAEKEEKPDDAAGKKEEKFMRLGDIEGQEFNNDSDDDSEDEQDVAVAKKKDKDEMGFELSSFNMREEMEEGKFTEDGNYVRSYDPHAAHDKWMDGFTETEIKLARKRHREQERKQREKVEQEERELAESGGQPAIQLQLLPLLKKGESILEALQRLGIQAKRRRDQGKQKRKATGDTSMSGEEPNPIEVITDLTSRLMSLGDADAYSKTYEEMVRSVRSSGQVDEKWEPPSADIKYEYRWAGNEGGEVFGPFGEDDMKSWYRAAYFGSVGEKVNVRRVGGEWGNWFDIVDT